MPIEFIRERSFENNGLNFAAKEWGRPGYPAVIALHGWLDNAASFDPMLAMMENLHVIAVDLAGHGRSDFRSQDAGYDIWMDIADVLAIADQMDWQSFSLLGHSRGAIISALVAGTFPQRVSHLALIDGYAPMPADSASTAKQLARAIRENKRFGASSATVFHSFERALMARVDGFVPLQLEAAKLLAKRGVVEKEGEFYWRNDQRLKAASSIKLTTDHLESFLSAITARVLLIQAQDSAFAPDRHHADLLAWIPQMQLLKMPGSHHLHMEDQAQQVAEAVETFFA